MSLFVYLTDCKRINKLKRNNFLRIEIPVFEKNINVFASVYF